MEENTIEEKFKSAINDLTDLCAWEIMRYSMQNFMEWFTLNERVIIANTISANSYKKALSEINKYFYNLQKYEN